MTSSALTTPATIACTHIQPNNHPRILALATAVITISDIPITIHGIQVIADANRTEIRLPKYRATDGTWLPAISVPNELHEPLGDTVIAAALEAGILRSRVA